MGTRAYLFLPVSLEVRYQVVDEFGLRVQSNSTPDWSDGYRRSGQTAHRADQTLITARVTLRVPRALRWKKEIALVVLSIGTPGGFPLPDLRQTI
jgi:hypothetical protein